MEAYKTIPYKGLTIKIVADSDPMNPRTEYDNLGKMVCCHKSYAMGDKHSYHSSDYNSWDAFLADIEKQEGPIVWLPIFMYDHSGQTINTTGFSDPWDSGQLGFIYVTKAKLREEYSWKVINKKRLEQAKQYLIGEVETYDDYLTGNVYGYEVQNSEGTTIHSCWGYFGDPDKSGVIEDARGEADCHIEQTQKEHAAKLKAQIKSKTPLDKRLALSV
jgi:hypothetical protein